MYACISMYRMWNSQVGWLGNLSWDKLISQVLVFEFSYINPLWKPSFCYINYFREGVFRIRTNGQLWDTSSSILFRHSFVLSYWESQAQVRHNKYVLKETTLRALLFSSGNSGSQGLFWLTGPLKQCMSVMIYSHPNLSEELIEQTEVKSRWYRANSLLIYSIWRCFHRSPLLTLQENFNFFICCWAFKVQLRKNRARLVAGY